MPLADDALLARGAALFNNGEYFACHELWEELWKRSAGDTRGALQGLIQAAVALLHAERGNRGGAISVYQKAMRNLATAPDNCMGLELRDFASALEAFFDADRWEENSAGRPQINFYRR